MLRLKKTIRLLSKLGSIGLKMPRETATTLDLVPSVNAGRQFGREAVFSSGGPTEPEICDTANPLLSYFNANTQGPGIFKWVHYFDIYQRHFSKFVGREVHILEVGIYSGGSLKMWKHYFGPRCKVYGVDIEPACLAYKDERTEVFIGDQADRTFWKKVKEAAPVIDILIAASKGLLAADCSWRAKPTEGGIP